MKNDYCEGTEMASEWHELTDLTGAKPFVVTSVKLADSDICIEGEFELPLMARLSYEDQVFIGEFVRSHGSIKQLEKSFGISYPTVKNRLSKIVDQLQLVSIERHEDREEVLDLLEAGEISADEAAERLLR